MPAPKPPVRPARRRGLLVALVVLLVLVAALVASLPALLSTPWGLKQALAQVNARAPVRVEVASWKVRWFKPPEILGVRVVDPKGRELLTAERVRGTSSLIQLARQADLGEFTVQRAALTLDAPPPATASSGTPAGGPGKAGGASTRPAPVPAAGAEAGPVPPWPMQQVRLVLSDASVSLRGADGKVTNLFTRLQATAALNPTNALATVRGRAHLPLTGGEVAVECDVNGDPAAGIDPSRLQTRARLGVRQLPAGPALAFARSFAPLPDGEGVWDADLTASGTGTAGLTWQGTLTGDAVAFSGGPLGADRLQLGALSLFTRGEIAGKGVRGAELHLTNALARVDLSLREPGSPRQGAEVDADINLAGFVRQLPGLFSLKDGVAMENGRLLLRGSAQAGEAIAGEAGSTNLTVHARLENVSGSLDGQIITFAKAFTADATARLGPGSFRVDKLEAATPLGHLTAEGDAAEARLALTLPLETAFAEAGKFFDTGAWEPAGELQVRLRQTATGGVRRVTADLRSPGFSLAKSGAEIVRNHPLILVVNAQLAPESTSTTARAVTVLCQLPFVRGSLTADAIAPAAAAGALPAVEGLRLAGQIDLAGLLNALFAADLAAKPSPFATAALELSKVEGGLAGGELDLTALEWKLGSVTTAARGGEAPAARPDLSFAGKLRANPLTGAFAITNAVVEANGLPVQVQEVSCADPAALPDSLVLRLGAAPDVEALRELIALFTPVPVDLRLGGQLALEAGLRDGLAAVSIVSRDFAYQRGPGVAYRDPQMRLDAWVGLPDAQGRLTVRDARLITGAATLAGHGVIDPVNALFEGEFAYDLSRVTQLLRDLGVEEVSLTGRQSSAWKLFYPLHAKAGAGALFDARLSADTVEGYGLAFKAIELPLSFSNQVARLTLDAGFEGGRVHVAPVFRFDGPSATLRFDTSRPLIEDVKLTPALADRLLARLHPLFKGSSLIEGRVTLELKDFLMPLTPDWQQRTAFSGTLRLRNARVASSGLLQQALQAAKIREQQMELGDVDLPFTCVNGRVETKPIVAKINGIPLTFAGSVGLDTTLRYAATTPATEALLREWGLGSDVIKHLENTVLSLPVTGTLAKPVIDRDALRKQLGALAKDAAKDVLEEKAEDLLQNLLDKRKKKKDGE